MPSVVSTALARLWQRLSLHSVLRGKELLGNHYADSLRNNADLHICISHQFAVALEADWWCRLDADMLSLRVLDVADGVDATIEESAQTEDNMPPVEWLDKGDIEQSVICNRLWKLLNASAVVYRCRQPY